MANLDAITPDHLRRLRGNILVLTGAGISVASGLPTFRGNEGLYHGINPYDLASPEAFAEHPLIVWNWYAMRIRQGMSAQPNAAHHAIVALESLARGMTLITSNVDPLHERAGSRRVFKLHGNILETKCLACRRLEPLDVSTLERGASAPHPGPWSFRSARPGESSDSNPDEAFQAEADLPVCPCGGRLRPNVVWFGEYPNFEAMEAAQRAIPIVDIGLEVGTSGVVSYGFSEILVALGTPLIRINPDAHPEPGVAAIPAPAEEALPELLKLLKVS